MLRCARINGLLEGSGAVRHRGGRVDLHLQRTTLARSATAFQQPSIAWQLHSLRYASTSTSKQVHKTAPPPIKHAPRKPKVELRPAPVKANLVTGSAVASAQTPAAAAAVAKQHARKAAAAAKEDPADGLSTFETMKYDVADATKRGVLAPIPPDASKWGRVFHQMKELFKFYFRGMKQINTHRVEVSAIRKRVREGGPGLTRAESRFVRTYQEDLAKMVPFVIIVLVLEEVIPLIVLYAPWMLPSTCVLPSQRERIERKRRRNQIQFSAFRAHYQLVCQMANDKSFVPVSRIHGNKLAAIAGLLNQAQWGFPALKRRRIERHLTYIAEDDKRLRAEGMGVKLTPEEVKDALHERGYATEAHPERDPLTQLRLWLTRVDNHEDGDAVSRRVYTVAYYGAVRW